MAAMTAHLVALGLTEEVAAGYTAALQEEGYDTPADFDALSPAELEVEIKMKRSMSLFAV